MPELSAFWDDLNRELQDPEMAAEFAANQAAVRAHDREVNDAIASLAELDPDATVLHRDIWEGAVDEIEDDWFGAHLKPVAGRAAEEAAASFSYLQVGDPDRPLLQLGALFWLISETVRLPGGHVEGRSTLRFRRTEATDA